MLGLGVDGVGEPDGRCGAPGTSGFLVAGVALVGVSALVGVVVGVVGLAGGGRIGTRAPSSRLPLHTYTKTVVNDVENATEDDAP